MCDAEYWLGLFLASKNNSNHVGGDDLIMRDMRSDDLLAVVKIEQQAQVSPWARLSFEESLTKGNYCRVIEVDKAVTAYHIVSSVLDELHILNVVCAPQNQGLGLSHALMLDIITYAETQALRKVFLEVRASNVIAQSLYKKWGFSQIAVRKQYYRARPHDQNREDAYVYFRER